MKEASSMQPASVQYIRKKTLLSSKLQLFPNNKEPGLKSKANTSEDKAKRLRLSGSVIHPHIKTRFYQRNISCVPGGALKSSDGQILELLQSRKYYMPPTLPLFEKSVSPVFPCLMNNTRPQITSVLNYHFSRGTGLTRAVSKPSSDTGNKLDLLQQA